MILKQYGVNQPYMLDNLSFLVRFEYAVYEYDEFGQSLHENPSTQPFGFTGYQYDEASLFAQARQYSPEQGRFISQDKIAGFAESPFTLNSYTYCWNDPMNLVDSDGMYPTICPDGGQWSPPRKQWSPSPFIAPSPPFRGRGPYEDTGHGPGPINPPQPPPPPPEPGMPIGEAFGHLRDQAADLWGSFTQGVGNVRDTIAEARQYYWERNLRSGQTRLDGTVELLESPVQGVINVVETIAQARRKYWEGRLRADQAIIDGVVELAEWLDENGITFLDVVFGIGGALITLGGAVISVLAAFGITITLPAWLTVGAGIFAVAGAIWTIYRVLSDVFGGDSDEDLCP